MPCPQHRGPSMKRSDKAGRKAVRAARRKTSRRRNASKAPRRRSAFAAGQKQEVARLTRELEEGREQQTATSELLKVISSSSGELEPVFEAILENATRICQARFGNLNLYDGNVFRRVAIHNPTPQFAMLRGEVIRPHPESGFGTVARTKQIVHIDDVRTRRPYLEGDEANVKFVDLTGARTVLAVPMLKNDELLGLIAIFRQEVRPFTDRQIELVKNFADQAVIAIENARLLNELRQRTDDLSEALEQQTATSEVLKTISSSPGELEPVFQAMLEKAVQVCGAKFGTLMLSEGDAFRTVAFNGVPPAYADVRRNEPLTHHRAGTALAHVMATKQPAQIADVQAEPAYYDDPSRVPLLKIAGARTVVAVPMLKDDELVGAIFIYRQEVQPFTAKQIELLKNFASQAVIAIENTRLLNELRESLQQQTATADVLKVISASPGDLLPVFETMLANAVRICEANFGVLFRSQGAEFYPAAWAGVPPEYEEFLRRRGKFCPTDGAPLDRLLKTKQLVFTVDELAESHPGPAAEFGGARSLIAVPMFKDGELVGAIVIYRQEVRPFTDRQVALVSNFANQAVIAIENTRLLNELRDSLQQQTATADVLKVISSSPGNLEPIFGAILENATQICQAGFGTLNLYEGDGFRTAALHNPPPQFAMRQGVMIHPHPESGLAYVARTKSVAHIDDIRTRKPYLEGNQAVVDLADLAGARTLLTVPMLKEGELIGTISIYRQEVRPFSDKQIELVKSFAAQAVIAIENARLLNELRESLQQQTATSEVLKVISSSPGELEPVFNTMLANAVHICEAKFGSMLRAEDGCYRVVAMHAPPPAYAAERRRDPVLRVGPTNPLARVAASRQLLHITDVRLDQAYLARDPAFLVLADGAGARTLLMVPMLKENKLIGAIAIYRQEVRPFTEKQVELLMNFAAQAVIAIENARLLSELRESLQQQTATADVLKVISRSTFDLQTVLQTLVESAARLCDANKGNITRERDGVFYRAAESYGFSREFLDHIKDVPLKPDRGNATGRALLEGRVIHIPDVKADPEYTLVEAQRLGGYRTILAVPMLREGVALGVLTLSRSEARPFTDKQIELVTTFADQAAIAIENVRLFESVEARTRELAKSLEDLRTTQDRLVQTQKLASLGQLTAGIAHEIKNPLNFVNNFSGVSAEMIDELQEALGGVRLNEKKRSEITELMDTLRGNLDKVVQHGKRADAIVKNMLQHSREGSGEHRRVDINALVEESLNLAWHGARAEKQGFEITLKQSFDPSAGEVDLFPQDITRALLNLISNGFYAATKRQAATNGGDYEPTIAASTKDLGDHVEIRIRDNGTGIAPDVKEKMFNPFFTTKPTGEGTGLGLSISYDIIVKQHAGSIDVDTQLGEFTEVRIILPRTAVFL